jgi:hypothetical protein
MGEVRNEYNILVRKREKKRPPEKTRCKWEDNIKMDLHRVEGCRTIGLCGSGEGTEIAPYERGSESSGSIQ